MIERFIRHLREGFFGVGRHAAMSLSSASAVMITLVIISIFMMFTVNVSTATKEIESSVEISVQVDYDYEDQAEMDRINREILAIDGVANSQFYSKEQEFEYYVNSFPEEERAIFEPFKDDNPMHNAYYVEIKDGLDMQTIADQIAAIEGVYKVNYGGDSAIQLLGALNSVRTGGLILVLALSALAIFLVQNTIKVTIFARSNEIAIMRNVGAKNGFIRAPFVVEGIIIGILGAIIPILITIFGYIYLYNAMGGVLLSNMFELLPPHPFVLQLSLLLLGLGVLVGLIGSFLSVTKYLRWKR